MSRNRYTEEEVELMMYKMVDFDTVKNIVEEDLKFLTEIRDSFRKVECAEDFMDFKNIMATFIANKIGEKVKILENGVL